MTERPRGYASQEAVSDLPTLPKGPTPGARRGGKTPSAEPPRACAIEIVERVPADRVGKGFGVIVPDQIRINGVPVLASADDPIVVHEMDLRNRDCVKVTLTLFARLVHIGEEAIEEPE